jgi:hypothetical protein
MFIRYRENLIFVLVGLVMNGLLRSRGIVIVDDNNLLSSISSRGANSTPLLDCIGCAEDVSPKEAVITPAVECADMAAIGIDIGEITRFADPVRAETVRVMASSAGNSHAVKPPAATA